MNATLILAFINLALDTIERFAPELTRMVKAGDITPAEQAAVLERINKLRDGSAFSGPEWKIEPQ